MVSIIDRFDQLSIDSFILNKFIRQYNIVVHTGLKYVVWNSYHTYVNKIL